MATLSPVSVVMETRANVWNLLIQMITIYISTCSNCKCVTVCVKYELETINFLFTVVGLLKLIVWTRFTRLNSLFFKIILSKEEKSFYIYHNKTANAFLSNIFSPRKLCTNAFQILLVCFCKGKKKIFRMRRTSIDTDNKTAGAKRSPRSCR